MRLFEVKNEPDDGEYRAWIVNADNHSEALHIVRALVGTLEDLKCVELSRGRGVVAEFGWDA